MNARSRNTLGALHIGHSTLPALSGNTRSKIQQLNVVWVNSLRARGLSLKGNGVKAAFAAEEQY